MRTYFTGVMVVGLAAALQHQSGTRDAGNQDPPGHRHAKLFSFPVGLTAARRQGPSG